MIILMYCLWLDEFSIVNFCHILFEFSESRILLFANCAEYANALQRLQTGTCWSVRVQHSLLRGQGKANYFRALKKLILVPSLNKSLADEWKIGFNFQLYIIDVSQSVEHDHPHALEFLRIDCNNINKYFRYRKIFLIKAFYILTSFF